MAIHNTVQAIIAEGALSAEDEAAALVASATGMATHPASNAASGRPAVRSAMSVYEELALVETAQNSKLHMIRDARAAWSEFVKSEAAGAFDEKFSCIERLKQQQKLATENEVDVYSLTLSAIASTLTQASSCATKSEVLDFPSGLTFINIVLVFCVA